eukprot:4190435-Pyramimonas_sp.AAC.1
MQAASSSEQAKFTGSTPLPSADAPRAGHRDGDHDVQGALAERPDEVPARVPDVHWPHDAVPRKYADFDFDSARGVDSLMSGGSLPHASAPT